MLLRCENPDCPKKLFYRAKRRSRRVCRLKQCHLYIKRKDRRDWWRKNGNAWRKKWKATRALLAKTKKIVAGKT